MKMKDLERETGVSREAIRYYIREGLLPEPERPKKNVARYHQAHVAGIKTIKQLQQERDLPLEVIKPILMAKSHLDRVKPSAFADVIGQLANYLNVEPEGAELVAFARVEEACGLKAKQLLELADVGMITIVETPEGEAAISADDFTVVKRWVAVQSAGAETLGTLGPQAAQRYTDLAHWLADQETSAVYKQLVKNKKDPELAAQLQARIASINDLLVTLHSVALIRRLRGLQPPGRKKASRKKT